MLLLNRYVVCRLGGRAQHEQCCQVDTGRGRPAYNGNFRRVVKASIVLLVSAFSITVAPRSFASDEIAVPALTSPVTDLTNTLSANEVEQMKSNLLQYEQQTTNQIAALIVPTT